MDGIASPGAVVWPSLARSNDDDDQRALPDDWPTARDGTEWDGTRLLDLTRRGEGPFQAAWNVDAFIGEVEQILHASVVDIPTVSRGANHYVCLSPRRRRLAWPTEERSRGRGTPG